MVHIIYEDYSRLQNPKYVSLLNMKDVLKFYSLFYQIKNLNKVNFEVFFFLKKRMNFLWGKEYINTSENGLI